MFQLKVKRVYEEAQSEDGYRILVDRLWPRGLSKEKAHIDEWDKAIAPSNELRKWYGHVPERYAEFSIRYREELEANPEASAFAERIHAKRSETNVTLLAAAKTEENNAAVLMKWLEEKEEK